MKVIYTDSEIPETLTKSIFLAGPTPRNPKEVDTWRTDALKILEDIGYYGAVFIPEPSDGNFRKDYTDQVDWEETYLNLADCIVFWVPRDVSLDSEDELKLPGFTTNIEWGVWSDSGKVVLGSPEGAAKMSYMKHYAEKFKVPFTESLAETLQNALDMIGDGAERFGGEKFVPLFIWKTDSFQSWYKAQTEAGNRLDNAIVLWTFRPSYKQFVFLWILKVDVYVAKEDRHKTNEFVLSRTDISSILLYHPVEKLMNTEVVLVKEFRSPARTEDGFIVELPGGSSSKPGEDAETTAAAEIHEETGFYLDPKRLQFVQAKQLAGTLSAHQSHLFKVELDKDEIEWFKSQKNITYGNKEDTEITYIEVSTIRDIVDNNQTDWSTLGMILGGLCE